MPGARSVKRAASKASGSAAPKNKKRRGAIVQLEVPVASKKKGRVLTCGQGDVGQLGLGEGVAETSKFKFVSTLGEKIVDVYAGGMHTVALDSSGQVWTFGCNDEGALGRATSNDTEEGTPGKVTLPHKAVAISAGDSHTAALLENGDVYAWGAFRDSHGSMGLVVRGRQGKSCQEPVKLPLTDTCVAIASGQDHLVILASGGAVYTMGCGEQGQLGRLAQRSASRDSRQGFSALLIPAKVTLKFSASRIWAGYHATFALDGATNKMFAWGLNNYGQLGITGQKRYVALFSPTECDAFSKVDAEWQTVSCGQHHSLALDVNGKVYSVGRCEYGRLGLGDRTTDAESLELIPNLKDKKCISIAATTCSSFAVTSTGEVYGWGMGSEGQLGTGSSSDAAEPKLAPVDSTDGQPSVVSAGGQHTALLVIKTRQESTPEPEAKPVEEVPEPVEDITEPVKEPPKKQSKRGKHKKQESEVTTTSSVQASDSVDGLTVNGEETETKMEVDETGEVSSESTPGTDSSADAAKPKIDPVDTTDSKPSVVAPLVKTNLKPEAKPVEKVAEPVKDVSEPVKAVSEPVKELPNTGNKLGKQKEQESEVTTTSSVQESDSGDGEVGGKEGPLGTGSSSDAAESKPAVIDTTDSAGGQHTAPLLQKNSHQHISDKQESTKEPDAKKVEEVPEPIKDVIETSKTGNKLGNQIEQKSEVTTTSSVQASDSGDGDRPKINGDESKETKMEVDETDEPEEEKIDKPKSTQVQTLSQTKTEPENAEDPNETQVEEPLADSIDT